MSTNLDVVIVGAGPAGCAAAVQCRRLGQHPLLLDRTGRPGGLVAHAHSVENYPGLPPTAGPRMVQLLAEHLERFDLRVEQREVLGLESRDSAAPAEEPVDPVVSEVAGVPATEDPSPEEAPA